MVDSPLEIVIKFAVLHLTDDGKHFAQLGHGLDQVLLHSHLVIHNSNTSKNEFVMVRPAHSAQPFCKNDLVCGQLHVVADDIEHLAQFSHGTLQVLHHVHSFTSIMGALILRMGLWTYDLPPRGFASNAGFQNQIVAVLLHRIDEELLYRILLHSNTSYTIQAAPAAVLFSFSKAPGALIRSPQGVGIIAPDFRG